MSVRPMETMNPEETMKPTMKPTMNETTMNEETKIKIKMNENETKYPNSSSKDYAYNSYADWRARNFNQWTRIYDDNCSEENRLRIGSKPMKYFVNQYNSPQTDPFMEFTLIGNQKSYGVRNDYERAIPTRLNPLYEVNVLPYQTTPFLGAASESRSHVDTSSNLRWGSDLRPHKSQAALTEVDYNRWTPNVQETVQNAGQYAGPGMKMQGPSGYFNPEGQNNVLFMNSAVPYGGISSRNQLHNVVQLSKC